MATEWKNLPDTSTPITAGDLIKDQTAVQLTEPTGGQNVWVKDSNNLFTSEMELGSINNSTGSVVVDTNAIRTADFIEVAPSTLYYVQNDKNYHNYTYQYDENKNFIQYNTTTNNPYSFTTTATTKYVKFRTVGGSTENDLTSKWWLVAGTSSTYQDYIENPSISVLREDGVYKEIYNKDNMGKIIVDDVQCKNLFDGTLFKGYWSATTNTLESTSSTVYVSAKIPIKKGDYVMSFGGNIVNIVRAYTSYNATNSPIWSPSANITKYVMSITEDTILYLSWRLYSNTDWDYTTKVQLEKGSEPTDYVPYKKFGYNSEESMGDIVVDDVKCKNLAKPLRYGYYNASTGAYTYSTNYQCSAEPIYVEPNTSYVFSIDGTGAGGFIYSYDSNNTYLERTQVGSSTNYVYTPPSNVAYFNYSFKDATISQVPIDSKIQIEKGSKVTNYEPHKDFGFNSGTGTDSNYIKLDDGTLICYGVVTITDAISTAWGNMYINSNDIQITYPYTFIERPVFTMQANGTNSAIPLNWSSSGSAFTTKSPKYRLSRGNSAASQDYTCTWIAIGRWK